MVIDFAPLKSDAWVARSNPVQVSCIHVNSNVPPVPDNSGINIASALKYDILEFSESKGPSSEPSCYVRVLRLPGRPPSPARRAHALSEVSSTPPWRE